VRALEALQSAGVVDDEDAAALAEAYRFCERSRNALYLLEGHPADSLPVQRRELVRLGLLLGYVHQPDVVLRDTYRRLTRRARRTVEHLFYGTR
jgi:glutamate-ammonia-ligase adenylyltransferase